MPTRTSVLILTSATVLALKDMGEVYLNKVADFEITIPNAVAAYEGLWYRFVNINTGIGTVKDVAANTITIVPQFKDVLIVCDGTQWLVTYIDTIVSATEPASYNAQTIWLDTTTRTIKYRSGGNWVAVVDIELPRITVGAVEPATPAENDLWLDTAGPTWKYYDGADWVELAGGGGGEGASYNIFNYIVEQAVFLDTADITSTNSAIFTIPIVVASFVNDVILPSYLVMDMTADDEYGTQARTDSASVDATYDMTADDEYGTQARTDSASVDATYDMTAYNIYGTQARS